MSKKRRILKESRKRQACNARLLDDDVNCIGLGSHAVRDMAICEGAPESKPSCQAEHLGNIQKYNFISLRGSFAA